jgi:uncharacterized protein (TIGR02391 family)
MITPKYINQALTAIRQQGLIEQDFEITSSNDELRIRYKKADFYFLFGPRAVTPPTGGFKKAVDFAFRPYPIEYKPNILSESDLGPDNSSARNFKYALSMIGRWLAWIKEEYGPFETPRSLAENKVSKDLAPSLAHLHLTIQQAAGSLYATGHYRQALLDAYIAVDTAVREKSQLTGSGTRLMELAFSPGNPVLRIGASPDEQQGFMALFRGAMLAIRNPKAHSLNGTHDAQRALEWLSFASVLLRNLDEAVLQQPGSPIP